MGRIYVAGSVNMDVTVRVAERPQPGETVVGDDLEFGLGGKGTNQAVAAARLGSAVSLIGRVGTDNFGEDLLARLEAEPLSLEYLERAEDTPSGTAVITVDEHSENAIVIVPGANDAVAPEAVTAVPLSAGDVAVSQFEVPQPTIRAFFETAADAGATTVLNPAPAAEFHEPILPLVDHLVVNETEALFYAGSDIDLPLSEDELVEVCATLRAHDDQTVVVTLGDDGVFASTTEGTTRLDAHAVDPVDTTGAGDAFVGAFATALEEGENLRDALAFANAAGALAATAPGASPSLPTREEVRQFLDGDNTE